MDGKWYLKGNSRPAAAVEKLHQDDREQGEEGFLQWFREVMAEDQVDLTELPHRAFMAGYAWAAQFRWE